MIEWNYLIIGIVFTIIMIRILKGIIPEILFFGVVLGLIFSWHWEFTTFLGFPHLPGWIYGTGAGILVSWIGYRIWLLIVNRTRKGSMLRKITMVVFGKVEKLKLG